MLTKFQAICSLSRLKLKFPADDGIGEVRGDQVVARTLALEELNEPYAKEVRTSEPEDEGNKRKAKDAISLS